MNQGAPDWFHNAVVEGLQRLQVLGLAGTPGAETVILTAQVWIETLWQARSSTWIEARDLPRIAESFRAVAVRADRWPAPRHVLENLPAAAPVAELPAPRIDPVKLAAHRARSLELLAQWKGQT